MRNKFMSEASDFVALGDVKPQTLGDLVRLLGVADATQRDRDAAIRRWLSENEPTQLLQLHLQDAGYVEADHR